MTACTAAIRPLPNDTELRCERTAPEHLRHAAKLRDYAYPGSETLVSWDDADRRTYHGEWPGHCQHVDGKGPCTLPAGHRGRHAP